MQWENRLGPPPEYVMTVLLLLSAWMANEIELLRSQIDRSVAPDPLKPALLRISYADANDFSAAFGSEPIYFRPNEAVSAALLMLESQRVRLVHFDPLAYVRWKGDRADTVDLRDTWARLAFLAEADPVFDF